MNEQTVTPAEYIVPLYMNGLQGRMLYMPAPPNKNRNILFVYGHHSTIERWWGVIQVLHRFGSVTVPDLPGFGGMQSLHRIGEKPTLDTMADYLAAFVKMRYTHKRVTILAMSYGFLVVTRMLQRYPELVKKVDLLFSAAGFAHKDDFTFSKRRHRLYLLTARLLATRPLAIFFRNVCLHPALIRAVYSKTPNAKHKFANLDATAHRTLMDVEVRLWRSNDVRTHWETTVDMLTVDNCMRQVRLPVYHIGVSGDQYFDNHRVEQHLRVVFADYHGESVSMKAHAPSVIATASEAEFLIPPKYRRMMGRKA